MIDIAYALLTEKREPMTLKQLMDEVRKLTGITEKAMKEKMQQFYTDMNIDGRFLSIDDNQWGLREWYPVDQIEVETAPVVRVRKKKKKKKNVLLEDDDEEIEDEEDEDELLEEDYDELLDEDEEEDEDDDEEEDEEEEEEIVEIEVDLLDADDDLEILPDDDELEIDDEDEEEE
jgi:DNA-directed RNA polymerase subunit delta